MAFFAKLLNVPTEPKPETFRDPVFLVGLMRSGTTLLMNTLSEHPQLLKVGFELNPIWTKIGGASINNACLECTEEDLKMEYANNMTAYFKNYLVESKSLLRHLARFSQRRFYGSGGVNYDWDNVYLLNKNPHLSNKVRYLNAMYPKAKYIVIVRSPHGQCASLKMMFMKSHEKDGRYLRLPDDNGSCWSNVEASKVNEVESNELFPGNFGVFPKAWIKLNKVMFDHLKHVPENQKVVIAYEELMGKRADSLNRIFKMLDLREAHASKVNQMIEKERKIHNTTTKGDPLQKWKKHLDDNEQKLLTDTLNEHREDYEVIMDQVPNSSDYWIH